MVTVLVLVVIVVGVISLAVVGLVHEQRELADRARRRAFVRWQQQRAEQQIQKITQVAFEAMLNESRNERGGSGPTCRG